MILTNKHIPFMKQLFVFIGHGIIREYVAVADASDRTLNSPPLPPPPKKKLLPPSTTITIRKDKSLHKDVVFRS